MGNPQTQRFSGKGDVSQPCFPGASPGNLLHPARRRGTPLPSPCRCCWAQRAIQQRGWEQRGRRGMAAATEEFTGGLHWGAIFIHFQMKSDLSFGGDVDRCAFFGVKGKLNNMDVWWLLDGWWINAVQILWFSDRIIFSNAGVKPPA